MRGSRGSGPALSPRGQLRGRVPQTPRAAHPEAQPSRARAALPHTVPATRVGWVAWLIQPPPGAAGGRCWPAPLPSGWRSPPPPPGRRHPGSRSGPGGPPPTAPAPGAAPRRLSPRRGARRADPAGQRTPWPRACAASRGAASGSSWVSRAGVPATPSARRGHPPGVVEGRRALRALGAPLERPLGWRAVWAPRPGLRLGGRPRGAGGAAQDSASVWGKRAALGASGGPGSSEGHRQLCPYPRELTCFQEEN